MNYHLLLKLKKTKGNPLVGFSNKILGTQKNIPLEQSALQAIISILNDLNRSDEDIIVIEEPENKVHPKIQGNLIEIIAERVEKGPSYNNRNSQ